MSTNFDMTWNDVQTKDGAQAEYLKLESGKAGNRIRIVSNPAQVDIHWLKDADGNTKRVVCSGAKCIVCHQAGDKPQTRFQLLVLDKKNWDSEDGYSDGVKVKVLEVGTQIIKQIKTYVADPD